MQSDKLKEKGQSKQTSFDAPQMSTINVYCLLIYDLRSIGLNSMCGYPLHAYDIIIYQPKSFFSLQLTIGHLPLQARGGSVDRFEGVCTAKLACTLANYKKPLRSLSALPSKSMLEPGPAQVDSDASVACLLKLFLCVSVNLKYPVPQKPLVPMLFQ